MKYQMKKTHSCGATGELDAGSLIQWMEWDYGMGNGFFTNDINKAYKEAEEYHNVKKRKQCICKVRVEEKE